MSAWNNHEAPLHPELISSRNLQCAGKNFGFIDPVPQNNVIDESDSDKSLTNLAEDSADEIANLNEDDIVWRKELSNNLPVSAQWMTQLHSKFRNTGKVKTLAMMRPITIKLFNPRLLPNLGISGWAH